MPRFFVADVKPDVPLVITGEDARHIALSLRMASGDSLTVSDGRGTDYTCRLTKISPDCVMADVLASSPSLTEPPVRITLYQAFPKGDKLDTVVQKAVELGARRIVPFTSEFCIRRPHADKWEKQGSRLLRIAEEAAKQSGRSALPAIGSPLSFPEMLAEAKTADCALFCYEGKGTRPLPACLPSLAPKTVSVIVGSEGGFSSAEATAAREAGLIMTGLGHRILRCETAPLFVLSALSCRYELS